MDISNPVTRFNNEVFPENWEANEEHDTLSGDGDENEFEGDDDDQFHFDDDELEEIYNSNLGDEKGEMEEIDATEAPEEAPEVKFQRRVREKLEAKARAKLEDADRKKDVTPEYEFDGKYTNIEEEEF